MRQADASDVSESIPVISIPELSAGNDNTSQDDSNSTNSFAELVWAARRVWTLNSKGGRA
eukprot:506263-Pyramimonas_sp.AAC.1